MLDDFAPRGVEIQRRGVAFHAFVAVAFDLGLDPHEQIGPDRLRAGVAAPDAACQAGNQEQPNRAHDQQACQVVNILRPEFEVEEIEPLVPEVEQHSLAGLGDAARPAHPRERVVKRQAKNQHRPFKPPHRAANGFRVDLDTVGKEVLTGLLLLQLALPVGFADLGHGAIRRRPSCGRTKPSS